MMLFVKHGVKAFWRSRVYVKSSVCLMPSGALLRLHSSRSKRSQEPLWKVGARQPLCVGCPTLSIQMANHDRRS